MSVKQSIMPVICLATVPLAVTARQMRSSVLEVNNMDYVRTAWSKGLRERVIVTRHILKNSLIPVVTMLGISVGLIFGGAVIEETMFAIAGSGTAPRDERLRPGLRGHPGRRRWSSRPSSSSST